MEKIELIKLTLDEIRKAADMIEACKNNYIILASTTESISDYRQNEIMDYIDLLDKIRIKLRDTLVIASNFQNAKDMLTGVDVALSKTAIELIHETKTDSDFENSEEE